MPVSSTEWMIPAVHPFSAESGPHEIRGPVIIDVNWRNTPNITSCATLSYEGVCNAFDAADSASIQKLSYPLRWGRLQPTHNQHIGESDLLLALFQLLEIQSAYDIELKTSQIYGKIYKYYDNISRFPHFNSPQPNLNLRKWIKYIQWNKHLR